MKKFIDEVRDNDDRVYHLDRLSQTIEYIINSDQYKGCDHYSERQTYHTKCMSNRILVNILNHSSEKEIQEIIAYLNLWINLK